MFLGDEIERIPQWGERWESGPFGGRTVTYRAGTTTRTLHAYQCEACGRVFRVLTRPTEPFFCDCQRLIGIEPAGALAPTTTAAG